MKTMLAAVILVAAVASAHAAELTMQRDAPTVRFYTPDGQVSRQRHDTYSMCAIIGADDLVVAEAA